MHKQGMMGLLAVTVLAGGALGEEEAPPHPKIDRKTGLIVAEGFELVRDNCTTECHSARHITQTRGRREDWLGLIRWMQETQELRAFSAETEKSILDYLTQHYSIAEGPHRRRPLPPELLPPPLEPPERRPQE